MKKIFLILLTNYVFNQTYEIIPYDWGGQFGYVNSNGTILWNKDWRSNRLFFDGTWSIYPRMYGPEIENGFLKKEYKKLTDSDSVKLESYFQYDQGDYFLDRLTIGLTYKLKNRFIHMHGFKRTFMGNSNQYDSGFIQPPQQTYLFTYESQMEDSHGGFSLAHFNTLSGFPDIDESSLYNSRITTSNIFWDYSLGKLSATISLDHFLQRYIASHSLSQFSGARYLTRALYQYKILWKIKEKNNLDIIINYNLRNIKMDSLYTYQWNEFLIQYNVLKSRLFSRLINYENQIFFDYGIKYQKEIGLFNNVFEYSIKNKPVHPYYGYKHESISNTALISTETITNSLSMNFGNSVLTSKISQLKDDKKFWNKIISDSINYKLKHRIIDCYITTPIFSKTNLYLNYKIKDTKSVYSDGVGNSFSLKLKNEFTLFNDIMIVKINGQYTYLYNRDYSININPIEMIPQVMRSLYSQDFNPINIINAGIATQVSRFMISIQWYNLLEILSSSGITTTNHFLIHPDFPELGRQINILIRWEFSD